MPFLHISLSGVSPGSDDIARLQAAATRLIAVSLAKRAELTAVRIETVPAGAWSVGGTPVSPAAHLEANITAGTNSAEEKARFVGEAHALLQEAAGGALPLATYVVIREIDAESWGYGGRTQAARRAEVT